jgi:hypothetical protein
MYLELSWNAKSEGNWKYKYINWESDTFNAWKSLLNKLVAVAYNKLPVNGTCLAELSRIQHYSAETTKYDYSPNRTTCQNSQAC